MTTRPTVGLLIGLAAGVAAGPALAQSPTWLERIFGAEKAQPAPPPAPPAPAAPVPAPEPAPKPAAAAKATPRTPLPPPRPAALATGPKGEATEAPRTTAGVPARPVMTAAADGSVPAPGPLTERQIVERANAYFNGISTLTGDFLQIGGDGRRLSGRLYVQRPGKLRFDYRAPSTLEVISDGSTVAVRDRKLATQDLYPVSQTPLKFLVSERVDLGRGVRVTAVDRRDDEVRVALEDRSTLGGTSRITLHFDPQVETLTKWRVVDPQGFETTVVLSNLDRGGGIDRSLFVIKTERVLGEGGGNR